MYLAKLEIRNCRTVPLTVIFEPWADELVLDHNALLEVHCVASLAGPLEVEVHDNAFIVFGLPGSTMKGLRDGKVIWECQQVLPPLPE